MTTDSWLLDMDGVLAREERAIPVTTRTEAERFPYRPSRIVDSVADLVDTLAP